MLLGPMLRAKREALGLTQAEVADHLGVPQPQVSRFETGHRLPSSSLMAGLVTLLQLDATAAMAAVTASSQAAAAAKLRRKAAARAS